MSHLSFWRTETLELATLERTEISAGKTPSVQTNNQGQKSVNNMRFPPLREWVKSQEQERKRNSSYLPSLLKRASLILWSHPLFQRETVQKVIRNELPIAYNKAKFINTVVRYEEPNVKQCIQTNRWNKNGLWPICLNELFIIFYIHFFLYSYIFQMLNFIS